MGRYVPSMLAAIGEVIEQHMISIGFMADPKKPELEAKRQQIAVGEDRPAGTTMRQCPRCGEASLARMEGCDTCTFPAVIPSADNLIVHSVVDQHT